MLVMLEKYKSLDALVITNKSHLNVLDCFNLHIQFHDNLLDQLLVPVDVWNSHYRKGDKLFVLPY